MGWRPRSPPAEFLSVSGMPARMVRMRVAIVHDWLYVVGVRRTGAAPAAEDLSASPCLSLFDFLPESARAYLGYTQARTSFIQRLPFAHRGTALPAADAARYRAVRPVELRPRDLEQLRGGQGRAHRAGPASRVLRPLAHALRLGSAAHLPAGEWLRERPQGPPRSAHPPPDAPVDYRTAAGPNAIIANSGFVARRIHKVYGRGAEVIPPPVTLSSQRYDGPRGNHFLVASRLVPYKNVEAVVRAFAQLPGLNLVVAGTGPEAERLKSIATSNVTFAGFVSDESCAASWLRPAPSSSRRRRIFGIIVVEAQSEGTPVLALGRGGARETVQVRGPNARASSSTRRADAHRVLRLRLHSPGGQLHARCLPGTRGTVLRRPVPHPVLALRRRTADDPSRRLRTTPAHPPPARGRSPLRSRVLRSGAHVPPHPRHARSRDGDRAGTRAGPRARRRIMAPLLKIWRRRVLFATVFVAVLGLAVTIWSARPTCTSRPGPSSWPSPSQAPATPRWPGSRSSAIQRISRARSW